MFLYTEKNFFLTLLHNNIVFKREKKMISFLRLNSLYEIEQSISDSVMVMVNWTKKLFSGGTGYILYFSSNKYYVYFYQIVGGKVRLEFCFYATIYTGKIIGVKKCKSYCHITYDAYI